MSSLAALVALTTGQAMALDLTTSEPRPGAEVVLSARNARPGERLRFVVGFESDRCSDQTGPCLWPALELGTVGADDHGVAVMTSRIPLNAPATALVFGVLGNASDGSNTSSYASTRIRGPGVELARSGR